MPESLMLSASPHEAPITHAAHRAQSAHFSPAMAPGGSSASLEPLIAALLDELGHGVILLHDGARVLHLNHAAQNEVRAGHSVAIVDGALCARRASDGSALGDALAGARRGLRKLVTLGPESERVAIALIPIGHPGPGEASLTVAVFGRRRLCERISVQCFARTYGLTPAESTVLELLSDGLDPSDIAQANEVSMTTVRSQVLAIRIKVGASSIRRLLQLVAMLPPMVSSLRC